jgi:hypothetical protein
MPWRRWKPVSAAYDSGPAGPQFLKLQDPPAVEPRGFVEYQIQRSPLPEFYFPG